MPELILKQLQYENDTWKRLLAFMMDENVHLKNKLSEHLQFNCSADQLEDAEEIQGRFIKEDERISLLRNDVAEMEKILVRELFEDGKIARLVENKREELRNNIINAENQFSKLKKDFAGFLTKSPGDNFN